MKMESKSKDTELEHLRTTVEHLTAQISQMQALLPGGSNTSFAVDEQCKSIFNGIVVC